ncbi:MAG: hypothetical protein JWN67_12 [Actinomycetia bacterium]|nr:hypothetical protein [Actinomycetes bacterium]
MPLLGVLVGAAGCSSGSDAPVASVREVRAFVAQHETATYAGRIERTGPDPSFSSEVRGELGRHGAWREEQEDDGLATEALHVDGRDYSRWGATAGLGGEQWEQEPAEPAIGYDNDVVRLLHQVRDVEVLGQSRLRGWLGPGHRGQVTVWVGRAGRLDRLVLRSAGEGFHHVVDLRFRGWGRDVGIAAPDPVDVDITPEIDEQGLVDFPGGPALLPTDLPTGWVMGAAEVTPHDEGLGTCAEARVHYVDAAGEPVAQVRAIEAPCPFEDGPRTGRPKAFGRFQGVLVYKASELWWAPSEGPAARVDLPTATIYVLASGDVSLLERLVPSLAPFGPAPPPSAAA